MKCDEVKVRLGELLDGELDYGLSQTIQRHIETCGDCRKEYEELSVLAAKLAEPPEAAPSGALLWSAIERRLDGKSPATVHSAGGRRPGVLYRIARRPLAAAAVLVAAMSIGWLALNAPWESSAAAEATIDFRPLLERADGDVGAGIQALLNVYGGEPVSLAQAAERVDVRVHASEDLPGGLHLGGRYLLNMGGHHRALAFHYSGAAGQLLLLQCPAGVRKQYGNRECLPCSIGNHAGQGVDAGNLRLMHMASDNVCVCIVSTLDAQTMAAALDAVPIDF